MTSPVKSLVRRENSDVMHVQSIERLACRRGVRKYRKFFFDM